MCACRFAFDDQVQALSAAFSGASMRSGLCSQCRPLRKDGASHQREYELDHLRSRSQVAHVSNRCEMGRETEARKTSRRRSVMDNSRSMQPRSGWTWKVWVGIVVGLAVVAGLIILIAANAGGGSGGGGSGGIY